MPRPKKSKASKPRHMVSVDPANDDEAKLVNINLRASRAEAARLKAQGAEVNIDKTTGLIAAAWRKDVFTVLRAKRGKPCPGWPKGRPALSERCHDAFRAHEADLHLSAGAAGAERRPDYIRSSTDGPPGQAVSAEALDAGRRVRETTKRLLPPDAGLLSALMAGDAALAANWRATVEAQTGEASDEGQTARIRSLGDNLHWARATALAEIKAANDKTANDTGPKEPRPGEQPQPTWFRGEEYG